MLKNYESHTILEWLTVQKSRLDEGDRLLQKNQFSQALTIFEAAVKELVEEADKSEIYSHVFGYQENLFTAQQALAAGYVLSGLYDDALTQHRSVAENVVGIAASRRQREAEKNILNDSDALNLCISTMFLVRFADQKYNSGEKSAASQLLDEAIRHQRKWQLEDHDPAVLEAILNLVEKFDTES
jgi:hypothetical protein